MNDTSLIVISMTLFTLIVVLLTLVVMLAKAWLVEKGNATLTINDDQEHRLSVPMGGKLLMALADNAIYIPSACGGQGTCGQCKVLIREGGGAILGTERAKLNRQQINANYRLSCQVSVKDDMRLELPPELFLIRNWNCTVRSNRGVATFIKELVLELPPGEDMEFRAGGYVQINVPPHTVAYSDFDIEERFRPEWDKCKLWQYVSKVDEPVMRAYSMANYPEEKDIIMLNVRIASPPASDPDVPPGKVSSYIYNLKSGDKVSISGPYGEFFARETNSEMIFVGGGSGMAPMRSHIFDQLKRLQSGRKISYWYGARSLGEVFYAEDFNRLEQEHANFRWVIGLSSPLPEDNWRGPVGFIHQILFNDYLKDHSAPEDCEYYLCGPPMMIDAVVNMLIELGVDSKNILFDKF
ncbi:MAG: NADH:ubiquinone reductase (Na(+)-transporting) subunit F [Methylicorpusculum sp.]|uniref:NADH:ubiquinone reductase (Na(+)-transporting) subunit F n=1 Tax=Methylicorpusculum sp. TaxID=2713644 RepID=UPI00272015FA|nr:NADH:ubiquinone reductase (Na(+)-transporting) subunit F [Methylicorpusculum sp.]MDO8939487.1 NADH:ubiquinone reductase (Na(+)-transporting) subunit F [Methylicorpusculum sp.]MDP2200632.1 NADH:ubiquinone reductase (Na(+)-transporting) subunit F [Methylicorpusculum sp.]